MEKSTEEQKIYLEKKKARQRKKEGKMEKSAKKMRKKKKMSVYTQNATFSIQISNESVRCCFRLYLFIWKMCHCAASLLYENWNAMLLRNMNRVLYFHPLRERYAANRRKQKK